MTYFLDTSAAVAVLRNRPPSVRGRLRAALQDGHDVSISTVVLYELWYGVARSERKDENTERLRVFLAGRVEVTPFEDDDARAAAEVRAALEALGTPIGPYDVLIAGQALRNHATLVTANVDEFARVPGLQWEDWGL